MTAAPYRLVDAYNFGWLSTGDVAAIADEQTYRKGYGLTERTLAELRAIGPVRPVEPPSREDEERLTDAFRLAGRKTVTTVAAAAEEVFHVARESRGGLADPNHSYEYAMRTLTAGRPGSWESEALKELVLFGNGLNLVRIKDRRHATADDMRRAGPSRRVHVEARREIVAVLTGWVAGPDRYTEVAENLAYVVSAFADTTAGPEGWRFIADQWLQPGSLARVDFVGCYRLLYSLSAHFDASAL